MVELTSVDYCECGHMAQSHKISRWFDEILETEIELHICKYKSCNCINYIHSHTQYFENTYVQF